MRHFISFLFAIAFTQYSFATCIFSKPVEVRETNIGNVLSWNTVEEKDNETFVIQKSLNGFDFSNLGEIKAAGTSTTEQKYRFLDISTGENKVFYRIAYIDSKKITAYTPTFMIKRNIDNNFIVTGMSSLTTDSKLSFSIRSAIDSEFTYSIINDSNKLLQKNKIDLVKGANLLTLNVTIFPKGDYIIRMENGRELEEIVFRKVESHEAPNVNYVVKE